MSSLLHRSHCSQATHWALSALGSHHCSLEGRWMTRLSHPPTHQQAQPLLPAHLLFDVREISRLLTNFSVNLPGELHFPCQPSDPSLQPSSPQHPQCLSICPPPRQSCKTSSLHPPHHLPHVFSQLNSEEVIPQTGILRPPQMSDRWSKLGPQVPGQPLNIAKLIFPAPSKTFHSSFTLFSHPRLLLSR